MLRLAAGMREEGTGNENEGACSSPFSPETRRETPRGSSDVSQGLNRCTSASRKRIPWPYKRFLWSISSPTLRVPKFRYRFFELLIFGQSILFHFQLKFKKIIKKVFKKYHSSFEHIFVYGSLKIVHLAFLKTKNDSVRKL